MTEATDTTPYVPLLESMHFVMIMGGFIMLILWYDLQASLKNIADAKTGSKLHYMFYAAFSFYAIEFLFTLGTIISAMCPVALWSLGVCHYSIKVIVSYSYCTRTEIALKGSMKFTTSGMKKMIGGLQWVIIGTATLNLLKVFVFYRSWKTDAGVCQYDIAGFWGFLDEIMFGAIDLLTLGILIWLYKTNNLGNDSSRVIRRIIYMSGVTIFATVFAVTINIVDGPIGLTASILDISTDVITMMKIYTRPKVEGRSKSGTRLTTGKNIRSSRVAGVDGSRKGSLNKKNKEEKASAPSVPDSVAVPSNDVGGVRIGDVVVGV